MPNAYLLAQYSHGLYNIKLEKGKILVAHISRPRKAGRYVYSVAVTSGKPNAFGSENACSDIFRGKTWSKNCNGNPGVKRQYEKDNEGCSGIL